MKWYYWVAIAVGAYLIFFRKVVSGAVAGAQTLASVDPQAGTKLTTVVRSQDPGDGAAFDTNPQNYVLVSTSDPSYPGYDVWYRSKLDGSWWDHTTGDFYSAGSSPPTYGPNAYQSGEMIAPTIDTSISFAPTTPSDTPASESYGGGGSGVIY